MFVPIKDLQDWPLNIQSHVSQKLTTILERYKNKKMFVFLRSFHDIKKKGLVYLTRDQETRKMYYK